DHHILTWIVQVAMGEPAGPATLHVNAASTRAVPGVGRLARALRSPAGPEVPRGQDPGVGGGDHRAHAALVEPPRGARARHHRPVHPAGLQGADGEGDVRLARPRRGRRGIPAATAGARGTPPARRPHRVARDAAPPVARPRRRRVRQAAAVRATRPVLLGGGRAARGSCRSVIRRRPGRRAGVRADGHASRGTPRMTLEIPVGGMSCASCVAKIEAALRAQAGVAEAMVNLATERATVRYAAPATPAALVGAIRDLGYEVGVETVTIPVRGMSCASCVARIEGGLAELPGVVSASVNFAAERATVT